MEANILGFNGKAAVLTSSISMLIGVEFAYACSHKGISARALYCVILKTKYICIRVTQKNYICIRCTVREAIRVDEAPSSNLRIADSIFEDAHKSRVCVRIFI